jgi:hypothetical protein
LTSTRILTRRRLGVHTPSAHAPVRRRRARSFVQVATTAASDRLRLNAFGHAYLGVGLLLAAVLVYLVLAAQVTQASYDITRLQDQQRQLVAEQDQLRYQEVTMHAPAQVEQSAVHSGMQRMPPVKYVPAQVASIDLQAPVGDPPADSVPIWERAVAMLISTLGVARDAMASTR